MSSFDRTFEDRLREKVKDMRARRTEDAVRGLEMALYHQAVGAIAAIDEILALCDEVRKALLKE